MAYTAISVRDPRLQGNGVEPAELLFGAARLDVPAISFGDRGASMPEPTIEVPDVYWLRLTDAVVHPPYGIITIGQHVLHETLDHVPFHLPGYQHIGDQVTIPSAGIGALVASALPVMGGNYTNHFHFVAEILPKLQIEPLASHAYKGAVLFPPAVTAPLCEMIAKLTEGNRPVYSLTGPYAVHVKGLHFVPNLAGSGYAPHPGLATFFDNLKRLLGVNGGGTRRIYVTRKDSTNRMLVNEDTVIERVRRAGFEIITLSGMDLSEQARIFAGASHIIAPHGAGLVNLLFCNPGVAVCELHMSSYLNWCIRRLSGIRNARYGCIIGEPIDENVAWVHSKRWSLDLAKLDAVLNDREFLPHSTNREAPKVSSSHFFDTFFPPGFSEELRRNASRTSDHSLCTDGHVFSYLIERFRPRTIIEVGSWHGHSANLMAQTCRTLDLETRILCVDTFLGSVEHWEDPAYRVELHREAGRPAMYESFIGNVVARGNADMVFPLPMDSANAALLLRDFHVEADLIFIDAAHDNASVLADIERFYPLLSANGVMFGDDYQADSVAKAAHDFAQANGLAIFVSSLKWIFATPNVLSTLFPSPTYEMRRSREGWVHPAQAKP